MINKNFLTNRICEIASSVTKKVVCEIGADHGYITYQLFKQKKIKFAYLTDISNKSLQKAQNLFEKSNLLKKVDFAVGDGLEAINKFSKTTLEVNPIQQIVIAGMGGKEIIKILTKNNNYTQFVLQPQKNVVDLRNFLVKNNYKITKDKIVKDGKMFYDVIVAKKSNKATSITKNQLLFGKTNLKLMHQDFVDYLHFKKEMLQNILQKKQVKDYQLIYKKILKLLQNT